MTLKEKTYVVSYSFIMTVPRLQKKSHEEWRVQRSFYSLDEFFCVKMIYNTVFCKMFAVFYTVNLYILCIDDLFHILLSL